MKEWTGELMKAMIPFLTHILAVGFGFLFAILFLDLRDLTVDKGGRLNITNYNSPEGLSRHLEEVTLDELDKLKSQGFFKIQTLSMLGNEERLQISSNSSSNDRDRAYYSLAGEGYYDIINKTNHFHVTNKELVESIHQLGKREDDVVIEILRLVSAGEKPFGDTEFKVAFSKDLDFKEAKVCRDNSFWATAIKIRSPESQARDDRNIELHASASEDCNRGGDLDACLIEEDIGDKESYNSESHRYSRLNDKEGKYIGNERFIRISLDAAKKLYPNKFDDNGDPIFSSQAIKFEEDGKQGKINYNNILKYCELGFIYHEES